MVGFPDCVGCMDNTHIECTLIFCTISGTSHFTPLVAGGRCIRSSDWTGLLGDIDPGENAQPFQRILTIGSSYDSLGRGYGLDLVSGDGCDKPSNVNDEIENPVEPPVAQNGSIIV